LLPSFQAKGQREEGDDLARGFMEGARISWISLWTLLGIGVAELAAGAFTGSVVTTADGTDSMSDAAISFVVWLGLKFSQKKPDTRFNFGYHKIETLAALLAAIGMISIGIFIAFHSFESLLNPKPVGHAVVAMTVLAAAAGLSWYRAIQMQRIANKYNLLSLKTDAKNSIKDGSASLVGLASIIIASYLGFTQMDAIGGVIIAGYIFTVAYVALKSSSLVLVDASYDRNLADEAQSAIETEFHIQVLRVLARPAGPRFHCELSVKVDGKMTVHELNELSTKIQEHLRSEIRNIERVTVIPVAG
jgi:cation diffusion facilitator family transporter